MKRLILVLGALTIVSGCSDHREREISMSSRSSPDLTLPDTATPIRDTGKASSARTEQPVSPVEQESPRARASAKPTATHPAKHKAQGSRHRTPPADTTTKGYAPTTPPEA